MRRALAVALTMTMMVLAGCSGGSEAPLSAKDEDICFRFARRWEGFSMQGILIGDERLMNDLTTPVTTVPGAGKYDQIVAEIMRRSPDYGWTEFADELRLSENDTMRRIGYDILDVDVRPDIGADEQQWMDWAFDMDVALGVAVQTCENLRGR